MCFLAIGMSSLEKCLFRSFARFFFLCVLFFGCLFFDTELQELFLCFWKLISCQVSHIICKYFLAFYVLSFHFHIYLFVFIYFFFCYAKVCKFNKAPFIYFCFYFHYLGGRSKRYCSNLYQSVFCLCFPPKVLQYPACVFLLIFSLDDLPFDESVC